MRNWMLACWFCGLFCVGTAAQGATPPPPSKSSGGPGSSPYTRYIQAIQKKLKKQPKSPRYHTILGRLYQNAGELPKSLFHYRMALKYSPRYPHAMVGMAHIALRKGDLKQAQRWLQRVLRRQPKHAPALAEQSEYWRMRAVREKRPTLRKRYLQRALQSIQKAITTSPKAHRYRYRLGLLYLASSQYAYAHVQFASALARVPFHPCYKLGLVVSESLISRKRASLYRDLRDGISNCNHGLLVRLGREMFIAFSIQKSQQLAAKEKVPDAIASLHKDLQLAPDMDQGHVFLALLYYQNHQCTRARQTLQRLLVRRPGHRQAKKLLTHSQALRCAPLSKGRFLRKTNGTHKRSPAGRTHIQIIRVTPGSPQPVRPKPRENSP